MSERKKILTNVVMGLLSQMVILLMGIVLPRIILVYYGSDTNGFTSTISQVFTYLGLLSAGISQSTRNSLYRPVQENDQESISYYISASRNYYRKISLYYLLLVIIGCFSIPFLLKTSIDYWTVFFYVLFEGLTGVISFAFLESWNCLLNVEGRYYISNSINLVSKILIFGLKIILAINGLNIALIQIGYFGISLLSVFMYAIYMRKKYGWIDYKAASSDTKLKDRKSFVVTELAWTVFSSTDMIVLSVLVSTSLSSVYAVYNMVFVAINSIVNTIYFSLNFKLGQAYSQNKDRYVTIHDIFNSVFVGGVCSLMATTYVMMPSFVSLYTKGVNDVNYTYYWLPLLFCLIQILSWSRSIAGNLISVAGRIKKAVWVSLVEAFINLSLSLILVQVMGITGVVLATVVALPLKIVYNNYVGDRIILKRSMIRTTKILLFNFLFFLAIVFIKDRFWSLSIFSWGQFFFYGLMISVLMIIINAVINVINNKDLLRIIHFLK